MLFVGIRDAFLLDRQDENEKNYDKGEKILLCIYTFLKFTFKL
jgi:hypothetical protein